MNYFNEEHSLFRESLRDFLSREVSPNISLWEKEGRIPKSIWKKMGDMGFLGLSLPEEYGGSNLDFFFFRRHIWCINGFHTYNMITTINVMSLTSYPSRQIR